MATVVEDPQTQTVWSNEPQNVLLVVFRYSLGTRLYLLDGLEIDEVRRFEECHTWLASSIGISSRVRTSIRAIPELYPHKLIQDTAERRNPPTIDRPVRVVLTGL